MKIYNIVRKYGKNSFTVTVQMNARKIGLRHWHKLSIHTKNYSVVAYLNNDVFIKRLGTFILLAEAHFNNSILINSEKDENCELNSNDVKSLDYFMGLDQQ